MLSIPRTSNEGMDLAYLGQPYSADEVNSAINNVKNLNAKKVDKETAFEKAVEALEKGQIISWYEGRSEHGPRALGNRSILALPHLNNMKDLLNSKIKFREEFRHCTGCLRARRFSLLRYGLEFTIHDVYSQSA